MGMISDGAGTGKRAKVDDDNRLTTFATTRTEAIKRSSDGDAFIAHSAVISLTDAVKTPIYYIKNNENVDLLIDEIVVSTGHSQELSGTNNPNSTFTVMVRRNPLTPTFNTGLTVNNVNFNSSKELTVDAFGGATGESFGDSGENLFHDIPQHGTRITLGIGEIVVPPGSSVGIEVIAPVGTGAGNDAMKFHVAMLVFKGTLNGS